MGNGRGMELARKKKKKKVKPPRLLAFLGRPGALGALGMLAALFPSLIARLGGILPFLLAMLLRIPIITVVTVVPIMSAFIGGHALLVSHLSLVIAVVVGFAVALNGHSGSKQKVVIQSASTTKDRSSDWKYHHNYYYH